MSFSRVSFDNVTYYPRDIVKKYIESQLRDKIKYGTISIFASDPDLVGTRRVPTPYIVLPENNVPEQAETSSYSRMYRMQLNGVIVHEKDKLGDDKVRIIRQVIMGLEKQNTQSFLSQFGVRDIQVTFDAPDYIPTDKSGMEVVDYAFTISMSVEVLAL